MPITREELFKNTGIASFYSPGEDNAYGNKSNGGTDTSIGKPYYGEAGVCATPWRNELKRLVEVLEQKIDPNTAAMGDVIGVIKDGKLAAVTVSQDIGGLEIPTYSKNSKRGQPSADIDLSPGTIKQIPGMKIVNGGLSGREGVQLVVFGSVLSYADLTPEKRAELLTEAKKLEAEAESFGRYPIYRPGEQKYGDQVDENGRRLAISENEAASFGDRFNRIRQQVYDTPSPAQVAKAQEVAVNVSNGEADISALKTTLGTEIAGKYLEEKKLGDIQVAATDLKPIPATQGVGHSTYTPGATPTVAQAKARLTSGMGPKEEGESQDDYERRTNNYMKTVLSQMSAEERMVYMFVLFVASLLTGKDFTEMLDGYANDPSTPEADRSTYRTVSNRIKNGDTDDSVPTRRGTGEAPPAPADLDKQMKELQSGTTGRVENVSGAAISIAMDNLAAQYASTQIKGKPAVVIDLGHLTASHTEQQGAAGLDGMSEPKISFHQVKEFAAQMKKQGFAVYFTHTDPDVRAASNGANWEDIGPRRIYSDKIIAEHEGRGVFVSFHQNRFSKPSEDPLNSSSNGFEVLAMSGSQGEVIAKSIHANLRAAGVISDANEPDGAMRDRGVNNKVVGVIKTNNPAILLEGGFLNNRHDAELLRDKAFLGKMVSGISVSVTEYAKSQGWALQPEKAAEAPAKTEAAPATPASADKDKSAAVDKGKMEELVKEYNDRQAKSPDSVPALAVAKQKVESPAAAKSTQLGA